jgi:ATP-dependent helicase HepA
MPLIDQFELIMHGVQAMRRRIELLACPIAGASGVRAQFYPHQVQNVQRILLSNRIHHLIADEVGMGKTIQALMIANALRSQKGKLRVRVIVPHKELQTQWINEVQCRAHCTAELGDTPVGDDWFDVVEESSMAKPSETLAPSGFDLLILDEPQSLKVDTLRFVASNSADFPRLLLLTASPNLRDPRRLLELLQILEPERVAQARREADSASSHDDSEWFKSRIGDLDDETLELVYAKYHAGCATVSSGRIDTSGTPDGVSDSYQGIPEHRRIRVLTETRWMYRNVLRSYRVDYPNHLPRREPRHIVIEPTAEESERMDLAVSYVSQFLETYTEPKYRAVASALLQRTALGGSSLQARIRQLRKGESEHEPRLVRMGELVAREIADTRLDCLVDWLTQFWTSDPTRKVVIAAEDNLTIEDLREELEWRLPLVGPRSKRIPLQIVTALDERSSASGDLDGQGSQTLFNLATAQLRNFEDTHAQLLLAHHIFRQSYNLQTADALVFFSLPWKPEDVDQWIGRVDRLGRDFVDPERPTTRAKPIRLVTIHRQGDPTQAVQAVLDEYRVFECAIDPERKLIEQISNRIEKRSLPMPNQKEPLDFENAVSPDATGLDNLEEGNTKLTAVPSGAHWTVDQAIQLHQEVARSMQCGPVLRQTQCLGYVSSRSEEALAKWIALLRQHKLVNITPFKGKKQAEGRRSRTYYTLGQSPGTFPVIDSTQDHNHRFVPFFIARANIQRPPRLTVNTALGKNEERLEPLQFLSFGSMLHRDLQKSFERAGKTTSLFSITVFSLGKRHYPHGTDLKVGLYLAGAGFVDSAHIYHGVDIASMMLKGLPEASGTRRESIRANAISNAVAAIESDIRFVRLHCRASMEVYAWLKNSDNHWESTSAEMAIDLFGANWSKQERPHVETLTSLRVTEQASAQFRAKLAAKIANDAKTRWSTSGGDFREALEERKEIIRIDAASSLNVLKAGMLECQAIIDDLKSNLTTVNEQRLQLNYQPQLRQLEEECVLIERTRDIRLVLLEQAFAQVRDPKHNSVEIQCMAAIMLENDPVPLPVVDPEKHSDDVGEEKVEADSTSTSTIEQLSNKPR